VNKFRLEWKPLLFAVLAVMAVAGWQALTVHYSFGGNWTALYYTGALFRGVPPALQPENIYVFPNSVGYDGQVYHYLAHDPLLRRNFGPFLDDPRYRARRILVPGVAFLLAFGRDRFVDPAYLLVIWLFVGLGVYWLGRIAPRFALGFLLVPATLVSIDRMTVDVALAACCVGFALYTQENAPVKLYIVLVAAALSRETGLLLPASYCLYLLFERRWTRALLFATAMLPAAAWYVYLLFHTPPSNATLLSIVPLYGIAHRLLHPLPYPFSATINTIAMSLDVLALIGILAALAWAVRRALQRACTPVTLALYFFALLTIVLSKGQPWADTYAFGRTLTPLVLLAALDGLEIRSLLPASAMLLIDPRILLQLGPQILNVLRGLF
jgi:hypothetical protein